MQIRCFYTNCFFLEGALICFSIDDSEPIGKKINTFAICGESFNIFSQIFTSELTFDFEYDLESL